MIIFQTIRDNQSRRIERQSIKNTIPMTVEKLTQIVAKCNENQEIGHIFVKIEEFKRFSFLCQQLQPSQPNPQLAQGRQGHAERLPKKQHQQKQSSYPQPHLKLWKNLWKTKLQRREHNLLAK